ncbi:Sec-independent protein translocase protein TatB [Rhizobium tubonense]|uniref:Sec-independent protein translocase protein TatB n=1 Tax=Rhizobium tubonense TaxID=484088 RepID=A0A2W4CL23_9HYPH|nr:Sec-independent protein translocase protein TatB [Rhizobium tubonense]PZM11175.1 twin-arginine translocase subunit TatB [Rhizobium tubonense]
MFDIGWTELLVIAVVLIVVVGPKDLPPMLRAFGKMMTRFRKVAGEFRAQFDEALKEADLDDVRQTIADAQKLNPMHSLREAMTPLRQMGDDIKSDLQRSTTVDRPPAETPALMTSEPSLSLPEAPPVIAPPPVVVAETPVKAKAVRKPRPKPAAIVDEPSVVEPAQVAAAMAVEKPKRAAARKPAAPAVIAEVPVAAPKKRAPAKKKDDA